MGIEIEKEGEGILAEGRLQRVVMMLEKVLSPRKLRHTGLQAKPDWGL